MLTKKAKKAPTKRKKRNWQNISRKSKKQIKRIDGVGNAYCSLWLIGCLAAMGRLSIMLFRMDM